MKPTRGRPAGGAGRGYWRALVALAGVLGALVWADPAAEACGSWQETAGPAIHGSLWDVSASSPTDAWAVGWSHRHTLAEHWDGSIWQRVRTPNPGVRQDLLFGVVAITPSDAGAVGAFGRRFNGHLLLHWNGSVWRRQRPPRNAHHAFFSDVAATAPNDVWAVGASLRGKTRIVHFNGSGWTVVPSVSPSPVANSLDAVSAASRTDVWAVGGSGKASLRALAEHWNGHRWRRVAVTGVGLSSVATISPTDAWTVGEGFRHGALVEHWDGTAWTRAFPPGREFAGVAAAASNDVWIAAVVAPSDPPFDHWDGTTWRRFPLSTGPAGAFRAIANVPTTTDYWAVGSRTNPSFQTFQTPLAAFYC